MGQANKRGTREERVKNAILRNEALNKAITESSNVLLKKARTNLGIKHLASRLIVLGFMTRDLPTQRVN